MNITPHHTACVAALLTVCTTLALCAPQAQACSRIGTPAPAPHLTLIWPHDGAVNVPVDTQLWYSARGFHEVRLTRADTDTDVQITPFHAIRTGAPGSFITLDALEHPLEPGATYTLHLTSGDTTTTQTFSTAPRGAAMPSPPDIQTPRVYRQRFDRHIGDSCDPFRYNIVRFVEFDPPPNDAPILYTITDSARINTTATLDPAALDARGVVSPHIQLRSDQEDPYDDPCLTLRWIDPFGHEGTFDPICDPDACIEPDTDGIGWPTPDFNTFAREHCGDLPDDGVPQGSGSDEGAGCTAYPSRRPSRLPTPLLALAALLLTARRLRRGRTT